MKRPVVDRPDWRRRAWLRAGALLPLVPAAAGAAGAETASVASASRPFPLALPPALSPLELAASEPWWQSVRALYDVTGNGPGDVAMLDNGYWGSMARPVAEAYGRHVERVNRDNALYGRLAFPGEFAAARSAAARALGVADDEIVLTRGATEALQALVGGYNRLRPGDTVLCADTDYDNVIANMHWLAQRRGVEVVRIDLPEPATYQSLVDAYWQAMQRHPRLRMMVLTHVSHRHGLVLPVAEISRMARERGIDVIVDTAHGFGQLDMRLPDLGADFAAVNLHKWIGAPVGVGAAFIRRGRVPDIDPHMGERDSGTIDARVHTGTVNFAAYLAVPLALQIHAHIGVANKQARLHRLRNRWVDAVRGMDGIDLLAPADPRLASAIASFRLRGRRSVADNVALAKRLLQEHGVFTVMRDGLASGACVRVTPAIFTSEAQVDRLVAALTSLAPQAR